MDTTNTNNIAQRRTKDWDEVLLYDQLRRGPNTKNEQGDLNWEDSEWSQTLEKLYLYLKNDHSRRRLLRRLFVAKRYENPNCTEEEYLKYAENSSQKIVDYTQGNPDYWRKEKLKDVAQHLHGTLAKQNRPHKSMDELFKDYLNAGTPEEDPNDSEGDVVRDHHGDKVPFIKELFGESVNWPLDKILADPDPSEGGQFKSDDCVRLMTNNYLHRGFPKGIEGYVSGVVSNEYLGWEANYCHVMFIVGCEDETTVWEDFLEVQEDQLQLCNKKHPPSMARGGHRNPFSLVPLSSGKEWSGDKGSTVSPF